LKHTAHILQTPAYLGQNLAGEKDPHAVFYRVKIRSSALTIQLTVYEFSKIANFHSNPMSGLRSTRMDHQRPPHQALHWEVPGYKRGPGRPRTNWRGVIKNDLEKMGLAWEKSSISNSQQTRMSSECGSMRPPGCGMNQGQVIQIKPYPTLSGL